MSTYRAQARALLGDGLPAALSPLTAIDEAHAAGGTPRDRLARLRHAASAVRERLLGGPRVRFYRSFELVRFPYPSRYGLRDALSLPYPYLALANRVFIVQVDSTDGLKTILVSPSDPVRNAETPFFKGLVEQFGRAGPIRNLAQRALATRTTDVLACLERCTIPPSQVDYLTYDHLHTQDLRGWIGPSGVFPRARLLVMRAEWESVHGLVAPQDPWYCPQGVAGIDPARVVCLESSVAVGAGMALIHTPGHTEGNHSIVCHTPEGLLVTSENGICADAYAPEHSTIPGLKRYARGGMDLVLNGNTLERGLDQYLSMQVEKTLAGPSARDPRFPNIACSSEMAPAWFAPTLRPTFALGDLSFGTPVGAA